MCLKVLSQEDISLQQFFWSIFSDLKHLKVKPDNTREATVTERIC